MDLYQTGAGAPGQELAVNPEGFLPDRKHAGRKIFFLKDELAAVGVVNELWIVVPVAAVRFMEYNAPRNVLDFVACLSNALGIVPFFDAEEVFFRKQADSFQHLPFDE